MRNVTKRGTPTGGEEEGGASWGASKRGRSQTRTHQLEGRKREKQVGELRNVAGHKRGLTSWREGRWKSKLVSFEMWHVINEDSLTGGEEEGGVGWRASKRGRSQTKTHRLDARQGEQRVGGLR